MDTDDALAAGQGGLVDVLAPQAQDETYRQNAAAELAAYLAEGRAMLARCTVLARAKRGDRLGPIHAAARLMNANAQVAKALAHVALVERRTRTIVHTIQPPAPKNDELNSRFPHESDDELRAGLQREFNAILRAEAKERERLAGLAIGCCI